MFPLVECVMNFSEGRDLSVVDAIARAIEESGPVRILHRHSDAAHHRSVITLAGPPSAVERAAVGGAAKAAELIDLRRHRGEHPRVGATDVIPFAPLHDVTLEQCADLARSAGRRIATELAIPVYLYGAAARRQERTHLSDIRRGGFERLAREIETDPALVPDFGERRIHPSAGATVVGAREILIAYNVNLETGDLSLAREIARAIRSSSGGLPAVKALGLQTAARGQVQVSMNLTDYRVTPLPRVYQAIQQQAMRYGVRLAGSEIVGLVPRAALSTVPDHMLGLAEPSAGLILEQRLAETGVAPCRDLTLGGFLEALAGSFPVPSTGSAAALAVASAAAAARGILRGLPSSSAPDAERASLEREIERLASQAAGAVEEDARAYLALLESGAGGSGRDVGPARQGALESVLQIARYALDLARLIRSMPGGETPASSLDLKAATALAAGGARAAVLIGRLNLDPSVPESVAAERELNRLSEAIGAMERELDPEAFRARDRTRPTTG